MIYDEYDRRLSPEYRPDRKKSECEEASSKIASRRGGVEPKNSVDPEVQWNQSTWHCSTSTL